MSNQPLLLAGSSPLVNSGYRPQADIGCQEFPGRLILWLRINTDEQSEGEEVLAAEGGIEMTKDPFHTFVPWRKVAAGFLTVLRAVPDASLGGVLNFKKKQQEWWTLGEENADQFIREHRALLEPVIAAARLDSGVIA